MSVRQRILALRILDKQIKYPDIVRNIGVTVTLNASNNKRKETVSYGETNKK